MKRLSSEDLVSIKRGETEALKHIYEAHYHTCVNQMRQKINSSQEDAEDLMMDTILILRDNIMSGQFHNDNVGAYLLTVGINKWRNKIKRDRRLIEYDPSLIESRSQIINDAEGKQDPKIKMILHSLDSMKGNCKTLLHRNLLDGIPLTTLIDELGYKSYDVIKTTKSRCMKKLRNIISEKGQ